MVSIRRCSHCGYQVASVQCHRCSAEYCDFCERNVHRKFSKAGDFGADVHKPASGKYNVLVNWRDHKLSRVLQQCVECEEFTAKLWCPVCEEPYCAPCFKQCHSRGPHVAMHKPELLTYYRVEDHALRVSKLIEAAAAQLAALTNRRPSLARNSQVQEMTHLRREVAATTVQTGFRHYLERKSDRELLRRLRAESQRRARIQAADDMVCACVCVCACVAVCTVLPPR